MKIISVRRLEFTRQAGDTLQTGRVELDDKVSYKMTMRWLPLSESWVLDMATTAGNVIVTGAWVRDRCDCLMGVSTQGRPRGAIMSYNPKSSDNPTLNSFTTGGAAMYYLPNGMDPNDFTKYELIFA